MSDPLTTEIRRALVEVADTAPVPPDPAAFPHPVPAAASSRGRRVAVAVAAVAVLAVGLAIASVLTGRESSTDVATGPSPAGPAPTTFLPRPALPSPPLVAPTKLPDGVRHIGGITTTKEPSAHRIILVGAGGQKMKVVWNRDTPSRCGPPPQGTPPFPPDPDAAAYEADGGGAVLHWCSGRTEVRLLTVGVGEAEARRVARSVRLSGDTADLTLIVPAGFRAARAPTSTPMTVLVYGSPGVDARAKVPAGGLRLTVVVEPAWTDDLALLAGDTVFSNTSEVSIGGRPGLVGRMEGRTPSVMLVEAPSTLVTLYGEGVTQEQLLAAAASLAPADPSIVTGLKAEP